MRRHPEPLVLESRPEPGGLHVFRGMAGGFAPFVAHRSIVRPALLATVKPALLPAVECEPFIAVHVRLGAQRGTALSCDRHAIVDLLKMSERGALFASGSTFNVWASFLDRIPSGWHPGQRRRLLRRGHAVTLEPEWSIGDFSGEFVQAVRGRLGFG